MKDKDLFYYMFENNSTKDNEVMHLIQNLEEINPEGITDEQILFVRDFYFRLLFRIAVLEYKTYSNAEVTKMLNLDENIEIFDAIKVKQLKRKFRVVIDKIREELEKTKKEIIVKEEEKLTDMGELMYIEETRQTNI